MHAGPRASWTRCPPPRASPAHGRWGGSWACSAGLLHGAPHCCPGWERGSQTCGALTQAARGPTSRLLCSVPAGGPAGATGAAAHGASVLGTPAGCSGWGGGREAEAASTLRSWWAGVSGWTGVPWWAGGSWCAGVVHTVCRKEPGMSGQDCDLSWHRGGWLRAPRPLYPGALPRARSGTASSGQGRRQCPGAWKSRLCPETQGAL